VFANNQCSGCHTLSAADAAGTTGPSLDKEIPGQSAAKVRESIVDPSAELTQGYADVMPKNFGELMSPQEVDDLVSFLLAYSGPQGGKQQGGKQK
jgi:mono/diheme cytochrome c family protein